MKKASIDNQTTQVVHWHQDLPEHYPTDQEQPLVYEFRFIPPQEDDCCFEVCIFLELLHPTRGLIFQAQTRSVFPQPGREQKPHPEALFEWVEWATADFIQLFRERTRGTSLALLRIKPAPRTEVMTLVEHAVKAFFG